MKLDKRILVMGVGAGVGAITPTLLKNYVEPSQGSYVPYMNTLGVWGTWHVFVPLVSGAAAVVLTQFTNLFSRHEFIGDALAMYGFAALFSAVVAGATEAAPAARARAGMNMNTARPRAYVAGPQTITRVNGSQTPTSVSRATIVA